MKKSFRTMLAARQDEIGSLVCVGLDPLVEKMPPSAIRFTTDWENVAQWMIEIVDATAPFASMYKPQRAYFESIIGGELALRKIIFYILEKHPQIPVFLDCKRGDIDRTQRQYRKAHLELDGAGGMNFSPYMGMDCMAELCDNTRPGAGIVGLCRTSNPSAWEIQDIVLPDGRRLYEYVAERILAWSKSLDVVKDAGLVMGAAHKTDKMKSCPHYKNEAFVHDIYSRHLVSVRRIVGDLLWFLIPGIGTQGGFVEETIRASYMGPGSVAVNSSSGIIFASAKEDYAEAAAFKTNELMLQIRAAVKSAGKRW